MFPKFYNVFNYSSIALVIVFLVLILTDTIPKEAYVPLLIVTIVILILRVTFRIYLQKYNKRNTQGE